MKDFFDIWVLAKSFHFNSTSLITAIQNTFIQRGTPLPVEKPVAFTEEFSTGLDKQNQWQIFCRRIQAMDVDVKLEVVTSMLHSFLSLPVSWIINSQAIHHTWAPSGPWAPAE